MLRHLPEQAKLHLLQMYNKLWKYKHIPTEWKRATIIPIPKPNKDHTNPSNHRPITLTSCLCKVLEKMINKRVMQYVEAKKIITNIKCGFRKHRSTIDQLIRLDTYLKQGMADNKATVEVFFDLEKA